MITGTRFQNVMTDVLREIERCPDDSIRDITNEMLEKWGCDWRVDHSYTPVAVYREEG